MKTLALISMLILSTSAQAAPRGSNPRSTKPVAPASLAALTRAPVHMKVAAALARDPAGWFRAPTSPYFYSDMARLMSISAASLAFLPLAYGSAALRASPVLGAD